MLSLYATCMCFLGRSFGTGCPIGVLFPEEEHLSRSQSSVAFRSCVEFRSMHPSPTHSGIFAAAALVQLILAVVLVRLYGHNL